MLHEDFHWINLKVGPISWYYPACFWWGHESKISPRPICLHWSANNFLTKCTDVQSLGIFFVQELVEWREDSKQRLKTRLHVHKGEVTIFCSYVDMHTVPPHDPKQDQIARLIRVDKRHPQMDCSEKVSEFQSCASLPLRLHCIFLPRTHVKTDQESSSVQCLLFIWTTSFFCRSKVLKFSLQLSIFLIFFLLNNCLGFILKPFSSPVCHFFTLIASKKYRKSLKVKDRVFGAIALPSL